MKRNLLTAGIFIALAVTVNLFTGCEKDNGPEVPVPENDSITMGAGYATDIFYSLKDGIIAEVPRTNWDIAFSVNAQSSAILINEAAGVELKAYPTQEGWTWNDAVDLTDYDSWDNLYNPDTTWAEGAFGMNAAGGLNYGWGDYNMATHNVEGVSLYIIKTRSGAMMKIFIEMKYSSQQRYTFKYAGLDGKAEQSVDLDCSTSEANFVYYSLDDNLRLDREPAKDSWDMVFTKYVDNTMVYPVTGVLTNEGVESIEKDATTIDDVLWSVDDYSDDINIIGSDWKSFDMENMKYVVEEGRVYIVKNMEGKEYLLHFTGFDMTNGRALFTKLEN